jgi:hypothetical protein
MFFYHEGLLIYGKVVRIMDNIRLQDDKEDHVKL